MPRMGEDITYKTDYRCQDPSPQGLATNSPNRMVRDELTLDHALRLSFGLNAQLASTCPFEVWCDQQLKVVRTASGDDVLRHLNHNQGDSTPKTLAADAPALLFHSPLVPCNTREMMRTSIKDALQATASDEILRGCDLIGCTLHSRPPLQLMLPSRSGALFPINHGDATSHGIEKPQQ